MTNIVILVKFVISRMRVMLFSALNILLICSMGGATYAASLHTQSAADQAFSQALPAQLTGVVPSPLNQSVDIARFQQAIADDLSGRPSAARSIYDVLKNTELSDQIKIPSAINLAALGRFDEAKSAFSRITLSSDTRESHYAQLWQLWLIARNHTGKIIPLKKQLAQVASNFKMAEPYQQAIVDLYAGKGSVDAVFKAVQAIDKLTDIQKRNVITEATFFTGGYLRYVDQDKEAELRLYQREQSQLCLLSLERPFISHAVGEL
ncbi:TPA: hypothetical protein ACKP1B_004332 [Serratia fonticola]